MPARQTGCRVQAGHTATRQPGGYEVVHVPFVQGEPNGKPLTVVSGDYCDADLALQGASVGLPEDREGALPVVDGVGNSVFLVCNLAGREQKRLQRLATDLSWLPRLMV